MAGDAELSMFSRPLAVRTLGAPELSPPMNSGGSAFPCLVSSKVSQPGLPSCLVRLRHSRMKVVTMNLMLWIVASVCCGVNGNYG